MGTPRRNARQRKRIKWLATTSACQPAVGREEMCEGVLLTRANRTPPDYWAENDSGVKCVLRKRNRRRGLRGWDVLLQGGGVHEFKTKRAACDFVARLRKLEVQDEDGETTGTEPADRVDSDVQD